MANRLKSAALFICGAGYELVNDILLNLPGTLGLNKFVQTNLGPDLNAGRNTGAIMALFAGGQVAAYGWVQMKIGGVFCSDVLGVPITIPRGAVAAAALTLGCAIAAVTTTCFARRSPRAQIRAPQGSPAYRDAQQARDCDILVQRDGRWVVLGKDGRIHIFERDGELVTSFVAPRRSTWRRCSQGQWLQPMCEDIRAFRELSSRD